jgi:ubiquinone/menaquinone biosynthesis C-methylase UbiE
MTGPPRRVWLVGRALSGLVAHVPAAWPLLRRPTQRFWDRFASQWDQRSGADSPGRSAALEAACDRLAAAPHRIVDLGTGSGAAALMLARRFPDAEVLGIDLSEEMVAAARRKIGPELEGRVRFAAADVAALPHSNGAFDLVAQLNLPVYFDEVVRVLAPGGAVIVASTHGPETPYYTPERTLRRGFAARGLRDVEAGTAGAGTFFIARAGDGRSRA